MSGSNWNGITVAAIPGQSTVPAYVAGNIIAKAVSTWQAMGIPGNVIAFGIAMMNTESGYNVSAQAPGSTGYGLGQFLTGSLQDALTLYNKTYDGDFTAADYQSSAEAQIDIIGGSLQTVWNRAVALQAQNSGLASQPTADVAYGIWHQGLYASSTSVQGFLGSSTFTTNVSTTFNGTLAAVPSAIGGTNVHDQLVDDAITTQIQQSGQLAYSDANAYYQQQLKQVETSQGLSAEDARNYLASQYGVSTSSPAPGVATISETFDLTNSVGIASASNVLTELEIPLSSTQTASGGQDDSDTDPEATAALNAANRQSVLNQWTALLGNISGATSVSVDGSNQSVSVTGSNGTVTVNLDGTATFTRTTGGIVSSVTTYNSSGQQLQVTAFNSEGATTSQSTDAYNSAAVLDGSTFSLNSIDADGNPLAITLGEDSSGDVTNVEFAGGSVLLGPSAQQSSLISSDALTISVGPSGTAQIALQNGEASGSPVDVSGIESMTLNLDGSYSIVDQSGNAYSLQPLSGSSNYVLGNSSGTLNVTLDTNSLASINLGQSISIQTLAGGTFTVPVWGGSATLGSANLGDATVEEGSSVTIGSGTIDVSAPGSGTTQQYSFASDGSVSSLATFDDSSAQTSPITVESYDSDGNTTQLLTNYANGTSQIQAFNPEDPSAGYITQTENFSGINGTGTLVNKTTDFINGLSEVDSYNTAAGALVTKTLYSDLDGTGEVLSTTTNFTDGTSIVTTYASADTSDEGGLSSDGITAVTTTYSGWDGTGSVQSTVYSTATEGTISDGQVGSVLGSAIGKILGGNNVVESIGFSSVLGVIGKDLGEAIDLQNADGGTAGDMSGTIQNLADSALPDVLTAGVGAVGAYLTGDLVKDLGITGLPAEVVDTGAGFVVSTIATNLTREALGATNVAWDSGLSLTSFTGAFAGFAGVELATLTIKWDSPQEEEAAEIGATLGAAVGSIWGPWGSFAGGLIGDILGGIVGSAFGGTYPKDPSVYGTLVINQNSSSPYSYQLTGVKDNGPVSYLNSLGTVISTELNEILAQVGGTISNAQQASGQMHLVVDAVSGQLGYGDYYENNIGTDSSVGSQITNAVYKVGAYSDSKASSYISAVVFEQLSDLSFVGGDVYVEKAINETVYNWVSSEVQSIASAAEGSGTQNGQPDVSVNTLVGNIQIAKDYEKYLANDSAINGLIAQNPTSNFAAGWIIELEEAASLGLNDLAASNQQPWPPNTLKWGTVTAKDRYPDDLEQVLEDPVLTSAFSNDIAELSGSDLALTLARDSLPMTVNGNDNRIGITGNTETFVFNGSNNVFVANGNGSTATVNGDSDSVSMYGNGNSVTVNGRYTSIVVSGLGNTVTNANGSVTVGDSSSATINGVAENISLSNLGSVRVNGGNMIVNVGGDSNTVVANGNDEQFKLAGDSNTVTGNGQGDEFSLIGTNENVTLGSGSVSLADEVTASVNGESLGVTIGNQDNLTLNGQYSGVNVDGNGDTVVLNGTSLGVTGTANAGKFTLNGSGDSISLSGSNNVLTANGNGNYLTVSGSNNQLVSNGQQSTATVSGSSENVSIANGTAILQNSSTATINGVSDVINVYNTTQLTVNGGSMNFSANGGENTVTLNGDGESVSVQGSNNAITDNGGNESVLVNGDSNNVTENGVDERVTVNGSYDAVQGQLDSTTVTINGTGGAITATGNNNLLTENGTNEYLTVTGNNNNLNANGQQITASLSGAGNTISIGNGIVSLSDNAGGTVNGVSDQVNVRNTSQLTVNGGSMSLAVNGNQNTITANGNANNFSEEGSSNLITGNGSNDSFSSNGNYNDVTLNGNNETTYINGTDNVLAVNGQNNQITFAGTNNTLHAGGASAFVLDNSTADFEGGGDSVTVYNGDTVTANGSGFSITETATNSSVVANGDYNVATVGGNHNTVTLNGNSGQVDLSGSLNTVTVSGQDSTLAVSGVQQALAVNQGNIGIGAGSQAGLTGNGNMVTLDASDTFTVNGSNNWVNAASNDSVTLMGAGNGIGGDATGVTAVLEGNGQYAILSNDAITVGAGIQASVTGSNNAVGVGAGGTLDLTGNGNSLQMTGATLNLTDSAAVTGSDPEAGSSASGFAVNGFDFTSYNAGQFSSAAGAQSLQSLADTGANSVSLVVTQYVQNVTDTNIESTSATESDASLELAISEAQADGLGVTLKPHLDVSDGTWRAYLDPSNVAQFFSNYQAMIVHYAEIAQATGVGTLVIGTEMESLSGTAYEPYWDTLIAAVRQVYSGQLTYASGWNETANVSFWNKLDIIGADAYIPVTDITDPTVQQLETGWTTMSSNSYDASVMDNMAPVDFYKSLSTEYDKPVLFTEIGYQSVNDTNELEGAFGTSNWVDFQQQSNALQAFFSTFSQNGGNWFEGAYLWNWEANPAGVEAGDFSVQGKAGLNIVDYWYGLKSGAQSGSSTPNTLTGDSNTITVGAGDALDLTGSDNQITLGTSAGVSVSGSGNQVQVTGGNNVIQTSGSTTIDLSGAGTTAMIAGDSDTVSATGANDGLAITGDNTNVSLIGNGEALTISGNNSTVNIDGNGDTVSISGDQSTITVSGMAAVIQTTGSTDVALGSGTDTVTLGNGVGHVTLGSGNDTIFLEDNDVLTDNALAGDSMNVASTVITESGSSQPQTNELAFSAASSDQLWFSRSGNDLLVSVIGTSSQIDITGWYNGSSQAVQSFDAADGKVLTSNDVNALVSAMAAFSPPAAGSITLPESYQNQLQPVIAANWH
ncbi:DUF3060 domain-containing protein [Paraburkholderia sediminicola]|uniref:glycoside hydrolase family 113 n=1 Tax=Paraburkholderia sediminicola TaxID=458836 RepID=UPI0038B78124